METNAEKLYGRGSALVTLILLTVALYQRGIAILYMRPTQSEDYVVKLNTIRLPEDYDPNLDAAQDYKRVFSQMTRWPEALGGHLETWPGELNRQVLALLKQWANKNELAFSYLDRVRGKPYAYFLCAVDNEVENFISIEHMAEIRESVQGAMMIARWKAHQGRVAEALRLSTSGHYLCRHLRQGQFIEQLVGIAASSLSIRTTLDILDRCTVRPDLVEELLETTSDFRLEIDGLQFTDSERLFWHDGLQRHFSGNGNGNGRLLPRPLYKASKSPLAYTQVDSYWDAYWICLKHPDRKKTRQGLEHYFREAAALAKQTPWDCERRGTTYALSLEQLVSDNYYLAANRDLIGTVMNLFWNYRADFDAYLTILASSVFRERNGHFPESLATLVESGLLDIVPKDPYSDASLFYRRNGGRFLLYSVGSDFEDDGGVAGTWGGDADIVFWPLELSWKRLLDNSSR